MLTDPDSYIFNTREECCDRHYYWNMRECLGDSPEAASLGTDKWYVDWDTETCIQDCIGKSSCGGISNTWVELYSSKQQCCNERLSYKDDCLGSSDAAGVSVSVVVGSDKWYVDWDIYECVQDCAGESPCGGIAASWEELYSSKDRCCDELLFWKKDCPGSLPSSSLSSPSSSMSSPSSPAVEYSTAKWYVKFSANTCVQDCYGASPCGGYAETWDELYDSKAHCCDERLFWVRRCLTIQP